MIWILSFLVVGLLCLTFIACGRITRLVKDLEWWRNEAIRLNNEKHRKE